MCIALEVLRKMCALYIVLQKYAVIRHTCKHDRHSGMHESVYFAAGFAEEKNSIFTFP